MEQYWIIARSVTYAQRMEKVLARAGIRARIFRAPRELSDRGCAYAVEIPSGALQAAFNMIQGAGLSPLKLYLFKRGSFVEIPI